MTPTAILYSSTTSIEFLRNMRPTTSVATRNYSLSLKRYVFHILYDYVIIPDYICLLCLSIMHRCYVVFSYVNSSGCVLKCADHWG